MTRSLFWVVAINAFALALQSTVLVGRAVDGTLDLFWVVWCVAWIIWSTGILVYFYPKD